MSYAICFDLDQSKILSSGNGLIHLQNVSIKVCLCNMSRLKVSLCNPSGLKVCLCNLSRLKVSLYNPTGLQVSLCNPSRLKVSLCNPEQAEGQPVQSEQADLGRNPLLLVNFSHSLGLFHCNTQSLDGRNGYHLSRIHGNTVKPV